MSLLPLFTRAERERRYNAVREQMTERGLDCLVIPHNTGDWDNFQPDVRYLTQIGGGGTAAACVFPLTGEPIAIVRDPQRVPWWKEAQDWVVDVRGKTGLWSEALAQAVRDLGCDGGHIGVVGLRDMVRDPEGTVAYTEWTRLLEVLPHAAFEDATPMMQEVRYCKSPEEITFVERAAGLADAASLALFETARPGVSEHELYAAMLAAMVRNGGEVPTMALMTAGPEPSQTQLLPTFRALERNDTIITEVDAKYGGYMAQGNETVCLGEPAPDYERMFTLSLECFDLIMERLRPGASWADMFRLAEQRIARERSDDGGRYRLQFLGHGMGLAEDEPYLTPHMREDLLVREGECVVLKPRLFTEDGRRMNRAGDTIVIEAGGARRLGRLPREMKRLG